MKTPQPRIHPTVDHVPNYTTKKGVLYFNPGSCGPRRFDLPITLGILEITAKDLRPQIVYLDPASNA